MIRWCGEDLPWDAAKAHFLVAGATGSGKTALLRILVQSVLGGEQPARRILIYDPKQDFLPVVDRISQASSSAAFEERICILNPFDRRGSQWDIAADTTNPAVARQIASILIPEDANSSSPFFSRAAQDIAYGVILSFIEKRCPWTLRDLVLALSTDPATTQAILELSPRNSNRVQAYFAARNETTMSVWSTLQTKTALFEPIAAGFARSTRLFSLTRWVSGEDARVLILRTNQAVREPIDAINAAIFRRLSELILDQADVTVHSPADRLWIVLDECREAGRLDGLRSLLNMGRSKGATVVIAFQDIDGLKAVYGDNEALELTGQCGNKALLRLESPATAEWCSSLFGSERVAVTDFTSGMSAGGGSQLTSGESTREVDRPVVLPSHFFLLPAAGPVVGIHGVGKRFDQAQRIEFCAKPFPEVDPLNSTAERRRQKLWQPSGIPSVDPRQDDEMFLEPWDDADLARIGVASGQDLNSARRPRDGR